MGIVLKGGNSINNAPNPDAVLDLPWLSQTELCIYGSILTWGALSSRPAADTDAINVSNKCVCMNLFNPALRYAEI